LKVLQWDWTEGASSVSRTARTTRKGMTRVAEAKSFDIAKREV
jgi:hypothetical protein